MISWVIYGNSVAVIANVSPVPMAYIKGLCTCLGLGSLVALPFIATLLDVRKKRHSARPIQDPAQFPSIFTWGKSSTVGKVLAMSIVLLMIGGLWLGIPQRPAHEALWHNQELPTNTSELNDFYKAVPDEENIALEYTRLVDLRAQKQIEFHEKLSRESLEKQDKKSNKKIHYDHMAIYENVMIAGSGDEFKRNEPIT